MQNHIGKTVSKVSVRTSAQSNSSNVPKNDHDILGWLVMCIMHEHANMWVIKYFMTD